MKHSRPSCLFHTKSGDVLLTQYDDTGLPAWHSQGTTDDVSKTHEALKKNQNQPERIEHIVTIFWIAGQIVCDSGVTSMRVQVRVHSLCCHAHHLERLALDLSNTSDLRSFSVTWGWKLVVDSELHSTHLQTLANRMSTAKKGVAMTSEKVISPIMALRSHLAWRVWRVMFLLSKRLCRAWVGLCQLGTTLKKKTNAGGGIRVHQEKLIQLVSAY